MFKTIKKKRTPDRISDTFLGDIFGAKNPHQAPPAVWQGYCEANFLASPNGDRW